MALEILGDKNLLEVETVKQMLRVTITKNLPPQIIITEVDWQHYAQQRIEHVLKDAQKYGATKISAESLSGEIFNWAVATRIRLI